MIDLNRVNFIFLLHFHQPFGQLKWIMERIFENSYLLLLDIFKKYSDLKFTVHISGPLLLYFIKNHSDFLEELFKLSDIGSIEFVAGSIGEAVLPIIPVEDRIRQIKRYLVLFEEISGFKPRGLWLPERIWEPHLPSLLYETGIEYVFVDDSTLLKTGFDKSMSYYVWNVEDNDRVVKVFFIDAGIRYLLPWEHPDRVIDYLKSVRTNDESRVVVWGSDAEKFGEWMEPERSKWWLEEFLNKMRFVRNEVLLTTPLEYLREYGVKGLIYLDTGSYDKMLEWSRGFFRNFLVKYAESNNMHKKMLYVRNKAIKANILRNNIELEYLLTQCNDAYWHGLFGGIYLPHLRQAIYEKLIIIEKIAEDEMNYFSDKSILIKTFDFDYDGVDELIVESKNINLYIDLTDGGTLFEYDIKKPGLEHNLQDTMTRYPEPYLDKPGFKPDWYRRVSWRIHLWSSDTSIYDWINNTPFKDISDLAQAKHVISTINSTGEFVLRTIGNIYVFNNIVTQLLIEKYVKLINNGHIVKYVVTNIGSKNAVGKLGLEYHVSWKINRDFETKPVYVVDNTEKDIGETTVVYSKSIYLKSVNYPVIELNSNKSIETWISPLVSYSRTEKGFREIYQGLAVMFIENVDLKPGDRIETDIAWIIRD
ncbi:MAG: alpha-amylase/4-alpha-glucanotransferase domain-containing protein [Desulfurococcaceae archaeon]